MKGKGEIIDIDDFDKVEQGKKADLSIDIVFNRIQCGDSRIQKYFLHCVGCWWARQNQASMETLLYKHTGTVYNVPIYDTLLFCG